MGRQEHDYKGVTITFETDDLTGHVLYEAVLHPEGRTLFKGRHKDLTTSTHDLLLVCQARIDAVVKENPYLPADYKADA